MFSLYSIRPQPVDTLFNCTALDDAVDLPQLTFYCSRPAIHAFNSARDFGPIPYSLRPGGGFFRSNRFASHSVTMTFS